MSDNVRSNVMTFLVGVIVIGTCYGLVADDHDRKVVTVTMPRVELERIVAQARIDAAREAFEAWRADDMCVMNWRNNPKPQGRM